MGILEKLFPPLKKERFALKALKLLNRDAGGGWIYDPDEFRLTKGEKNSLFLTNMYETYRRQRLADRKQVWPTMLALAAHGESDEEITWAHAQQNLLLRVRERLYHQQIRYTAESKTSPGKPVNFARAPLNDELEIELVLDGEQTIRSVSHADLADWNVSFDQALATAKDNLWRRSVAAFPQIAPGIFMSPFNDVYDAARMYLSDLVWQLPVKGQIVAAVPNRNVLLITGSEDVAGLEGVCKLTDETLQGERPMTGTLFKLEGNVWTSFMPPPAHGAWRAIRRAFIRGRAQQYAEQKSTLEKWVLARERDCFVASYIVYQEPGVGHWTVTTWADVSDELLAEADVVAFANEGKTVVARWADVVRVMSAEMTRTDDSPPRYHITRFPTPSELEAMPAVPVEQFETSRLLQQPAVNDPASAIGGQ